MHSEIKQSEWMDIKKYSFSSGNSNSENKLQGEADLMQPLQRAEL